MHGAAPGLVAVVLPHNGDRAAIGVRPPGDGLAFRIGPQIELLEVAQFIMWVEVLGLEARPALEANDFHSRLAELGRENPARPRPRPR